MDEATSGDRIEPTIGHLKNNGRLGRNFLLGKLGDKLNAVLCACGHNLRLMLRKMPLEGGGGDCYYAFELSVVLAPEPQRTLSQPNSTPEWGYIDDNFIII